MKIHLNKYIAKTVGGSIAEHGSASQRINEVIARLNYVRYSHLPKFSRAEWSAIFDANNGGPFPGSKPEAILTGIWANVADCHRLDALGEKWEVDCMAIVKRLRNLTPAEAMSVAESCRYFWDFCHLNTDEIFDSLGIQ